MMYWKRVNKEGGLLEGGRLKWLSKLEGEGEIEI